MTSKTPRTGNPAPVQAPWLAGGAPPVTNQEPDFVEPEGHAAGGDSDNEGVANALALDEIARQNPPPPAVNDQGGAAQLNQPTPPVDPLRQTQSHISPFSGQIREQRSPFAPKRPKTQAEVDAEQYPMGDAPNWGDFVRFIQKNAEHIIQARHPQPRGEAVDTIYRGVTVLRHPTCEIRHKTEGWISWEDSQYES
jgi:hypothetical protein